MKIIEGTQEIIDRSLAPKNKFWRRMQLAGAILIGVGTVVVSAPVSLPVALVGWGGYLVTVGATITSVSQFTKP